MPTKALLPVSSGTLRPQRGTWRERVTLAGQIILFSICIIQFVMLYRNYMLAADCVIGGASAAILRNQKPATDIPDYYQTTPEIYPGPTPTGPAGFLKATNPAPFPSTTYIPNSPLETQVPVPGRDGDQNIFELLGHLSHYFPNPVGFGVDEYPLPRGAKITQLHMLHRHGARYPTLGTGALTLGRRLANFDRQGFTGELAFLNDWKFLLGAEILVPVGKQELFDSGTLHQYDYGHLYPNDGSKIIARSTTQDRMTKSAEYFLAGFFGLDWPTNATLVLAVESGTGNFNNTLAGWNNCPNARKPGIVQGEVASREWYTTYLQNATERLRPFAGSFGWTVDDSYDAQQLCAYETVAVGYSPFCGLFTYEEWQGFEYSIDLMFAGIAGFQSPTGRAVGAGYVEELRARLQSHVITTPTAQVNTTLSNNTDTFPLHQNLYFDFTHDTNILAILTALGITQFAAVMPTDHVPARRQLFVSHVTPFAARLDIEIIEAPHPLDTTRGNGDGYLPGAPVKYVHFILNQRTLPLGISWPACGQRDDGWCEFDTVLEVLSTKLEEARFEFACFGEYESVPFGEVTNGVPVST